MNPETPTPREQLEARLTALLLGELPADEAAALRVEIGRDAELAALHRRLEHTIELVRETAADPVEQTAEQPTPLRLSEERREKLLAQFKTVAPKEFVRSKPRYREWLVPAAAAAALVVMAAIMGVFRNRREVYQSEAKLAVPYVNGASTHSLAEDYPPSRGKITNVFSANVVGYVNINANTNGNTLRENSLNGSSAMLRLPAISGGPAIAGAATPPLVRNNIVLPSANEVAAAYDVLNNNAHIDFYSTGQTRDDVGGNRYLSRYAWVNGGATVAAGQKSAAETDNFFLSLNATNGFVGPGPALGSVGITAYDNQKIQREAQAEQLEKRLSELANLPPEKRPQNLSAVNGDAILTGLLQDKKAAESALVRQQVTLGGGKPDVQATKDLIAQTDRQIEQRTAQIVGGMRTELAADKEAVAENHGTHVVGTILGNTNGVMVLNGAISNLDSVDFVNNGLFVMPVNGELNKQGNNLNLGWNFGETARAGGEVNNSFNTPNNFENKGVIGTFFDDGKTVLDADGAHLYKQAAGDFQAVAHADWNLGANIGEAAGSPGNRVAGNSAFQPQQGNESLETKTFAVNDKAFRNGLEKVNGGVGGGGGGGGIGGGGAGFGGAGGTGGGLQYVTVDPSTDRVQSEVRQYFRAAGVDFSASNGNAVIYNDRKGTLTVRATPQELDLIGTAITNVITPPSDINIKARFAEITQNGQQAVASDGFGWGGRGSGGVGGAGGVRGGMGGRGGIGGSSGGTVGGKVTLSDGSVQQVSSGRFVQLSSNSGVANNFALFPGGEDFKDSDGKGVVYDGRNGTLTTRGTPQTPTVTGIMTDPQYRAVLGGMAQRDGVDVLTSADVATESGRQAQVLYAVGKDADETFPAWMANPAFVNGNLTVAAHDSEQVRNITPVTVLPAVKNAQSVGGNTVVLGASSGKINYTTDGVNGQANSRDAKPLATASTGAANNFGLASQVPAPGAIAAPTVAPVLGDTPLAGELFRRTTPAPALSPKQAAAQAQKSQVVLPQTGNMPYITGTYFGGMNGQASSGSGASGGTLPTVRESVPATPQPSEPFELRMQLNKAPAKGAEKLMTPNSPVMTPQPEQLAMRDTVRREATTVSSTDAPRQLAFTNGTIQLAERGESATHLYEIPVKTAMTSDIGGALDVVSSSGNFGNAVTGGRVQENNPLMQRANTVQQNQAAKSMQAGGRAGFGTVSSTRDYPNGTRMGPVSTSIDRETGALIVITDDKTFGNVNSVIADDRTHQYITNIGGRLDALPGLSEEGLVRQEPVQLAGAGKNQVNNLVQDGRFLFEAGKYDEADARFKQALKMDPANAVAKQYSALALEKEQLNAQPKNEIASENNAMLQVDKEWKVAKNAPPAAPKPNLFNQTNLIYTGKGRETILSKLDRIPVDKAGADQQKMGETNSEQHPYYLAKAKLEDLKHFEEGVFFRQGQEKQSGKTSSELSQQMAEIEKKIAQAEQEVDRLRTQLKVVDTDPASPSPGATLGPRAMNGNPVGVKKHVISLKNADPQEVQKVLANLFPSFGNGSPEAIARSKEITILADDQTFAKVSNLVAKLDAPTKEVLLEQKAASAKAEDRPEPRVAAPALIPQPEVLVRANAFSTFSLNVSDVSFKLAGASLDAGVMPDPGTVRSEEFINAFDYRDPEPPPGARIGFTSERARYPFAHNRDLLRFAIKTAAAGRQPGRALNIVLLLDNSGSMERADRVAIIHEALRVLAAQLQPQDKLSVVTFARTARMWVDGISGGEAAAALEKASELTPEGGTNLEEAMRLAYETALRHYLAGGVNRVVLLTDGAANLGNVDPEMLRREVELHRQQGVALDCFGIGWEGYNDDLLEVLSRHGDGRYGFINTPEEAATGFAGQLAGAFNVAAGDVKVQVEFNPKRTTAYRQIGYAKHQLTKEQFRDNTVDAAEIAAAESGNALYTVDVNPQGTGPVCTVRVRYKVPGTRDYREQAWDVPYDGAAPALESASPAMRLAATASAFSEWLGASPFAAEVQPDRLLAYLNGVPEVYGADARPKKLEAMIRQAKAISGK